MARVAAASVASRVAGAIQSVSSRLTTTVPHRAILRLSGASHSILA
jgi:hypothetical protein